MLLVRIGSDVIELIEAVLLIVPPDELVGLATIVIGIDAPAATLENIQVTVPFELTGGPVHTFAGLTERKLTPTGSASVTTTLAAESGPLFVTCNK